MKRTFYTRIIGGSLIIVLILLAVGWGLWQRGHTGARDLIEIQDVLEQCDLVFESERGFGNDRFDVYSFSLKASTADQPVSEWKSSDQEFETCYATEFQPMLDLYGSDARLSEVRVQLEEIRRAADLRYERVERGSTTLLYMYSADMDMGYCLILTI
ncbi:MAG: hypothetical protein Q4D52_04965 [Eubacteriales bacterium]|nr:hypothetical protein [Eubacteriales bacterium]